MPTPLKSKGFYEPSGREILVSVSISVILTVAVIAGCIALLVMGVWYLAWLPIPVGLLVGLLLNVVFRGKDDAVSDEDASDGISDDYSGGQWSKEA